jgi:hypothetical protein
MTDDERLAALFRDAAGTDPPPAAFDHDRVVSTSRRITARRRSAVLGGAMALLVVTGVGVAAALPSRSGDAASTAAAPASAPGSDALAESAPSGEGRDAAVPDLPAVPAPEFDGAPLGPGSTECADRQDPALRAYLEQVLPEVAGAPQGAITMECRPGGERGVNLEVDDAGTPGLLTVQYLPPGVATEAVGGSAVQQPTASGGTVVVSARGTGAGAAVPFEGRLDAVAAFLAPRL